METYEKPVLEVIAVKQDIITASGCEKDCPADCGPDCGMTMK